MKSLMPRQVLLVEYLQNRKMYKRENDVTAFEIDKMILWNHGDIVKRLLLVTFQSLFLGCFFIGL